MSRARETTLTIFVMLLSLLKPKSCAGHNSQTVLDNLIIFGRGCGRGTADVPPARETTLSFLVM